MGTEVVTPANVADVYLREVDREMGRKSYADRLKEHFVDLAAMAKPLPVER